MTADFTTREFGGYPWEVPENYEKWNPSKPELLKKWNTPMLVIRKRSSLLSFHLEPRSDLRLPLFRQQQGLPSGR